MTWTVTAHPCAPTFTAENEDGQSLTGRFSLNCVEVCCESGAEFIIRGRTVYFVRAYVGLSDDFRECVAAFKQARYGRIRSNERCTEKQGACLMKICRALVRQAVEEIPALPVRGRLCALTVRRDSKTDAVTNARAELALAERQLEGAEADRREAAAELSRIEGGAA
jgi:hypothetical protein